MVLNSLWAHFPRNTGIRDRICSHCLFPWVFITGYEPRTRTWWFIYKNKILLLECIRLKHNLKMIQNTKQKESYTIPQGTRSWEQKEAVTRTKYNDITGIRLNSEFRQVTELIYALIKLNINTMPSTDTLLRFLELEDESSSITGKMLPKVILYFRKSLHELLQSSELKWSEF